MLNSQNIRRILSSVLVIMLFPLLSYGAMGESTYSFELTPSNTETIQMEYIFSEPKIERVDEVCHSIEMAGAEKFCQEPGNPILPVKTARILIPQGRDPVNIYVLPAQEIVLDGEFTIEYCKDQIPISRPDLMIETQPDWGIYNSDAFFPGKLYSEVSTQFLRGYKILLINLYPVQYIPAHGKVLYYPVLRLIVETAPAVSGSYPATDMQRSRGVSNFQTKPKKELKAPCRYLKRDISRVSRMIDNPSIINTYTEPKVRFKYDFSGSSLTGGPYEYVIITRENLVSTFEILEIHKASRGLSTNIVTVEDIYANYDPNRPDGGEDHQTQIRNFIKDAYTVWETDYVLLGGDSDGDPNSALIPHRGVYGKVGAITDDDIPCDLYYGALDGTWDLDNDGTYGEYPDDYSTDPNVSVDLLAEVYIGRIACDDPNEALNQINKIIEYENSVS
ncbi:MAG: C25 family cysteine peptidase, partial [bacterium]